MLLPPSNNTRGTRSLEKNSLLNFWETIGFYKNYLTFNQFEYYVLEVVLDTTLSD